MGAVCCAAVFFIRQTGQKRRRARCGARPSAETVLVMTGAVSRVLSLDGHLSGTRVAARLKPPVGTGGPPMVPVGVAADRVYRPPMLPWGAVSSYLAFPPLPRRAGPGAAVYLCCTIPRVAPGGRYPLSLPCAARTFLMPTHATVCTSHDFQYTLKMRRRQTGLAKSTKILYTVTREKGGVTHL